MDTGDTLETLEVALIGRSPERESATFYKPPPGQALGAALATESAQAFLDWARFPLATVTPSADGWLVQLHDLRHPAGRGFMVEVEVSRRGEVLQETVRFHPFGSGSEN